MWDAIIHLAPEKEVNLDQLNSKLVELGYCKEYQVDSRGQFAVRGGIIDIFPLTEENPVRIELWGDEIDAIRSFDVETQKSIEALDEIYIYPACEMVLDDVRKAKGIEAMRREAKKVSDALRKEMKTEEAHRTLSMV